MSLEKILVSIIAALSQSLAVTIIIFKQIDERKFNKKIFFFCLLFIYAIIGYLFVPNELRFIVFIVVISLILYFVLNINDNKIILFGFFAEVFITLTEIITSLLLLSIGINSKEIINNNFYNLVANILISLLSIGLISIPIVNNILKKVLKLFDKNKSLLKYFYILLLALYLILLKNGLELLLRSNYYINLLFIICVFTIIILVIKKEYKNNQLNEQNKQMLDYVSKYEKIITDQGKTNHEFKNQLMVIRGYAQMNSSKLIEYLDSITEDVNKTHSSYLISQLNKFPDGGIKGLLYYKLSIMDDEKIKYEINVTNGVKSKLKILNINIYKNITKVLGVLLDNAIDASRNTKDKKIIISVLKNKNIVIFRIYNTYKGNLDISKIGTGYTTKGKGHGYGLRLVKDIINSNKNFKLTNKIDEKYYITEFEIKVISKK